MSKLFEENMKEVSIADIVPNKINPNRMSSSVFKKLKVSIKKLGMLNPLVVRQIGEKYEIIDGEWRYRAAKELGFSNVLCKIVEVDDEEVKQLLFASTIHGRHNIYETSKMIKDLSKKLTKEELMACNLDKEKLARKIKYQDSSQIKVLKAKVKKKQMIQEEDSINVKDLKKFKRFVIFTYSADVAQKVEEELDKIDKDHNEALLKLLNLKGGRIDGKEKSTQKNT